MNRKQADIAVSALIACILLLGVLSAVQLHLAGGPMSDEMDSPPVMASFAPVIMSLVISSVVGGVYVFVRSRVFTSHAGDSATIDSPDDSDDEPVVGSPNGTDGATPTDDATPADGTTESEPPSSGSGKRTQVLDVLPDDERRILEPVIESPGLTQVKVRDRSGFSGSKVSQTVTDLEERGLLYRESQGRTYRVYPADDLEDRI